VLLHPSLVNTIFFPPNPSFFFKKLQRKIRAGNKPLTAASSLKSGTGEKKEKKHTL